MELDIEQRKRAKLDPNDLPLLTIAEGCHKDRSNGLCMMEIVAWVAGEKHSDSPGCVSPIIASFLRTWNDALPDDESRTRLLAPLVTKVIGTATGAAHEERRAWMLIDWLIREFTPTWLRLATLDPQAIDIETLPEIKDATSLATAMPLIAIAKSVANAAWAAARAAAWAAARAAAWAAACDAARAAACDALKPTTEIVQASALAMVERMIAVSDEN
jgi:hypothetical protein